MQADESTFRGYLSFWTGQLVSLLGSSIAQFVIIWWITLATGNPFYLALAAFLGLVPTVILAPFAGVLVDRWNRKMLIGAVDLVQALAVVALIILFWSNSVQLWQVFVLLGLRGVFQAFHGPAVNATVPLMVPRNRLSRMNGLNYLFSGAVALMGPIVAALLLEAWAIHMILWVDVVTFIVALIPLLVIRIPPVSMGQARLSFKQSLMEGLDFVKNARGFLPLLVLATGLNFLLTPLSTLLPYFVRFDHSGGATDLALVMAFFQGGILAGGLLMSLIKGFKRRMLAAVLAIYMIFVGYALVALTPFGLFWFMAASALVMTFSLPIANVSLQTIIQTVVPLQMQGRVGSVVMALASAATPLGMILAGAVVGFTGTASLFLGCAAVGMLLLTLSWLVTDVKHVEKMGQTTTAATTSDNGDE